MTKTRYISGVRWRRALGIAGLLIALCGFGLGTAVAAKDGDTKLDDSAKEVGNNFGKLLKGMGQEVKKAIGSDGKAAEKDKKKETEHADDKSGKGKEDNK